MFLNIAALMGSLLLKPTTAFNNRTRGNQNAINNAGAGGARGGRATSSDLATLQRYINQGLSRRAAVTRLRRRNGR